MPLRRLSVQAEKELHAIGVHLAILAVVMIVGFCVSSFTVYRAYNATTTVLDDLSVRHLTTLLGDLVEEQIGVQQFITTGDAALYQPNHQQLALDLAPVADPTLARLVENWEMWVDRESTLIQSGQIAAAQEIPRQIEGDRIFREFQRYYNHKRAIAITTRDNEALMAHDSLVIVLLVYLFMVIISAVLVLSLVLSTPDSLSQMWYILSYSPPKPAQEPDPTTAVPPQEPPSAS